MKTVTLPHRIFRRNSNLLPPEIWKKACIGCGTQVTPGLCDTGSIIQGMQFATVKSTERTPVTAIVEYEVGNGPQAHVIGGEEFKAERKIGYFKRVRGCICQECASNYHTIQDKYGVKHPIVQINVKSNFIGRTIIPQFEK